MADYKPGDVINFAYRNSIAFLTSIGNLIHYGKLGYTHSAIICDVTDEGALVYEASDKGIIKSYYPLAWLNENQTSGLITIGRPELKIDTNRLIKFCESSLGQPYDFMNLYDIAVYWITGRTNVKRSSPNSWICSEFVCEALHQSNSKLDIVAELKLPSDDYCAPMDIYLSKFLVWTK
jgi:hypothetical protein